MSENPYQELVDSVTQIFERLHFTVVVKGKERSPDIFLFYQTSEKRELAGEILMSIDDMVGILEGPVTRSKKQKRDSDETSIPTIYIGWLSITDKYQKRGLSKLLLIYGICYLKLKNPDIEYSNLEDASDNAVKNKPNIYSMFGFTHIKSGIITDTGEPYFEGPERVVKLDQEFIDRCWRALRKFLSPESAPPTITPIPTESTSVGTRKRKSGGRKGSRRNSCKQHHRNTKRCNESRRRRRRTRH
jgi:hypothetical protein